MAFSHAVKAFPVAAAGPWHKGPWLGHLLLPSGTRVSSGTGWSHVPSHWLELTENCSSGINRNTNLWQRQASELAILIFIPLLLSLAAVPIRVPSNAELRLSGWGLARPQRQGPRDSHGARCECECQAVRALSRPATSVSTWGPAGATCPGHRRGRFLATAGSSSGQGAKRQSQGHASQDLPQIHMYLLEFLSAFSHSFCS